MTRQVLPRDTVIDRLQLEINGVNYADPMRPGSMTRERGSSTLDLWKAAMSVPMQKMEGSGQLEPLAKDVNVSSNLTYYDLRAPAMNLFPTVTPLRNAIARSQRANPGDALHYKAITATTGSGFPFMGWVPERHRSASMSYSATTVTLPYVTMGEEDSLSDEARYAAEGFEDEDALVQLRLMLKMFTKEEAGILGGNATLTLATPGTIATSAGGANATLGTNTYSAIVVALTQEGALNSSLTGGVATSLSITGNDGSAYTLNGGSSMKSAAQTQAITLGQILSLSVPAVSGAVAYAWFVGTAGNEKLEAITNINSVTFSAPLAGTGQAATAIASDHSKNAGVAFDGLLTTAFNNAAISNAYLKVMATGTPGTGTGLTASGSGGIQEIDDMLVSMWNLYRVSPTVIYVNAQELRNITKKVLTNASGPLLRYNVAADNAGMVEYKLTAAGVVSFYFNPYTADGGVRIPIKIHPNLQPGTLLAWAERLPPWYVSNETPMVAEMLTRRDYTNEVWPRTNRAQYYGVYVQEALAVYAPFCMGVITNIGNA